MRVLGRIFILLLATVLLLGPALYLGRDSVAPLAVSWLARVGLGLDDLGGLGFRITELRGDALTLEAVTAGEGAVTAETIQATFDPAELRHGRLRTVSVTGLTLRGAFKDGRLDLGPLSELLYDKPRNRKPDAPKRLPFDTLALSATKVILGTPWGDVELTGDVSARRGADDALTWTGAMRGGLTSGVLGGGMADIEIAIDGSRGLDGTVASRLSLAGGSAHFRDLAVDRLSGDLAFESRPGIPPITRAKLTVTGARMSRTAVPTLSLNAMVRGGSGSMTATIGNAAATARNFVVAAAVEEGDDTRPRLRITGEGPFERLYQLVGIGMDAPIMEPRGKLSFHGDVTLPEPIASVFTAPDKALMGMIGTGGVDLSISSLRHGGDVHKGDLKARVSAIVGSGFMELRAVDRWRLRVPKALSRSLAAMAPEPIRHWFDDGLAGALGGGGAAPSVLVDFTGARARARISANWRGDLGPGRRVELGGSATVLLPKAGLAGTWRAELDQMTLRLDAIDVERLRLRRGEATFTGHVDPMGAAGVFTLGGDLTLAALDYTGDATVKLAGRVASRDRETRLFLGQLEIRADTLDHRPSGMSLLAPVVVSQPPGTTTEIAVTKAQEGIRARDIKAALDFGPLLLGLPGDGPPRIFKIAIGRVTGRLEDSGGAAGGRVKLALGESSVDDGRLAIAISGALASARFHGGGKAPRPRSFTFEIPEIASTSRPAWFSPMKVGLAGSMDEGGSTLALRGSIAGGSGTVVLPLSGVLRPNDGSGRLTLAKTAVGFGPQAATLADLSPALAKHVKSLTGGISLGGHLSWPDMRVEGAQRFSIDLDDLTVQGPEFGIEKANGKFVFSSLAPLRTEGESSLAMDMLAIGVAIEHPRLDFSIDGLDHITLHEVSGNFAGGTISARGIDFSPSRPTPATLRMSGVSASNLSGLAKVEGLHAEGSLSGVLPVLWTPGVGVSVAEAKLTADGPGKVRYLAGGREAALRQSGEQVGLMLDALSDFRFKTLDLNLDGGPGEGYRIALALEGANPNLYDGYPVQFNLDLSGQLDDIIKTGYRTYSLPTRVRDAVLRGEANE
jgi:hypothetical protein